MNPDAVSIYFAEKLQTRIRRVRPNGVTNIYGPSSLPDLWPKVLIDGVMSSVSLEKPVISSINDFYYFGTVIHEDSALWIGPLYTAFGFQLGNGLRFSVPEEDLPSLPEGSLIGLLEAVQVLHNLWNNTSLSFGRLLHINFYQPHLGEILNRRMNEIQFRNNETDETHGSYSYERRLVHAIRTGDMKLVMEATVENIYGSHGTVDRNELQNAKNLSIVGLTIASRAAIEGGLPFEVALSLTDSYFQQIGQARTENEVSAIVFHCNEHLARLVAERRRTENNPANKKANKSFAFYCKKAKDDVLNHLHEPLSVQDIAGRLAITPNYLSALFRQHEGIPLTRYILMEKISQAKVMLLYSPMPYGEIAMYLGFSSQSHFCRIFRQLTGQTPSEYRKQLT